MKESLLSRKLRVYLNGEAATPIIALFLLNAVDEFDTRIFESLGPEIAKSFGIGVGLFGTITLLVSLLVPLLAVPIAHLADRRQRVPIALVLAAVWGSFSIGTGFAPTLAVLIVMRVGSGFGRIVNTPVHSALIGDFYSPATRSKAFGIHSLANYGGPFVATIVGGFIASALGWRAPFILFAIPTALTMLYAGHLPEPERGRFEVLETPKAPPLRQTARRLWAIRSVRYMWIGLVFASGSILGISILVPFFLKEEFHMTPGPRGVVIGLGSAIAAGAMMIGTAQTQRRLNRSPSEGLRFLAWAGIVAAVALGLMAFVHVVYLVIPLIWIVTAMVALVTPGLYSVMTLVTPPEIRSSAFALGGMMQLLGAGFAIIGFVIGDSASVPIAVGLMAPLFLRGVFHFFTAAKYLDDDVERLNPIYVARARAAAAERGPVLLETTGVTVSYDTVRVLFGVDFEVREGEIVALLGTNGAGKSTLLNAISGVVQPDGGNVFFAGDAITGEEPEQTVRRGIVQVPGGRGVFPGLSVEENLRMGAFLLRGDATLTRDRIEEVLDLFPRLRERLNQKAGSMSGGERQMLTLAQSFLLRPRILLIDELSLGLAPTIVQELLEAVRRFNASGCTIVLVEQSVNIALNIAHRAYFLEKGEVRFEGKTSDLLERGDLLRSVFLTGARASVGD